MTDSPARRGAAPRISACIVCRNEADRLQPCLDSIAWVDEIVFMDLASTDDSAELARRAGARVVSREPVPVVEMVRNDVAAAATGEWILVIDPDERVSPGLAVEMRRLAARDDIDAVVVPRMNYDLGYPPSDPAQRYEPQLRMYRKATVSWPEVPNKLPDVPAERRAQVAAVDELVLVHDRSRNIPEVLDRSLRYATVQAQSMIDRGEVFTARRMVADLSRRALNHFVRGQAFRDGVPGILRAGILVGFHFYVWAAFWQLSGARRTPDDDAYLGRIGAIVQRARRAGAILTAPLRLLRRPPRR